MAVILESDWSPTGDTEDSADADVVDVYQVEDFKDCGVYCADLSVPVLVADSIWIIRIADSAVAQTSYDDFYWTGMICACHVSISNNYIIMYYLVAEKHVVV